MPSTARGRTIKADPICAEAIELARAAAVEAAGGGGVGDHLGVVAESYRVVSHEFAATHAGYAGWRWSVTVVRAARAKVPTVNEVVLLPGEHSLRGPDWVPWTERIEAGDVVPRLLMPAPQGDPRLEPGFTGGDTAADPDPAERGLARVVVAELGLGRERVLSRLGRDQAVERWLDGEGGPNNEMTRLAPGVCETCGFFVRLQGGLAPMFGVCANVYSASDGEVVSVDHGCGAHSGADTQRPVQELPAPVWETIEWDSADSLFD